MPYTVNRYLNVPNTGDLPGAWGTTAVNANMSALDGIIGGFATISLSSATTFALSLPAGAATGLTPGAGPSQSQNALIKFTGSLSGNAVVQFTMPGFYIVHNACTVSTFSIALAPSAGTGNTIGAPPGQKVHVFYDGTDMDYVDSPPVGGALDLHGATAVPAWMSVCTVRPYLIKDGSTYSSSIYPALAAMLGSTFGGNGASTFGVPDERARARIALDTASVATGTFAQRLTTAICGFNGTTMGAAGGSQSMQSHAHTATVTDPSHSHVQRTSIGGGSAAGISPLNNNTLGSGIDSQSTATAVTGITVAVNGTGSGSSGNVMPAIVSFLPLIKT